MALSFIYPFCCCGFVAHFLVPPYFRVGIPQPLGAAFFRRCITGFHGGHLFHMNDLSTVYVSSHGPFMCSFACQALMSKGRKAEPKCESRGGGFGANNY